MSDGYTPPNDTHRLLQRQLRKAFSDGGVMEDGLNELLKLVNASYEYFDEERELNRRAQEISSQELFNMNSELQRNNEFLDSFNHGLAHDIKNHSSNLQGLTRMMKKYMRMGDDVKLERILDRMELSLNQMSTILNGFLYLSKTETIDETNIDQITPDTLRSSIMLEIEYLLDKNKHNLQFDFEFDRIKFSLHVLRIIFVNLISNAIKFSKPEGVKVLAHCKVEDDMIQLKVRDNGIGMDLENPKNKVFTLFYRAEMSPDSKGFGIGLFMIKKIIDLNRGSIHIESALDQGATFNISLPLHIEK